MPISHPTLEHKSVINCEYLGGAQIYNLLDKTFEIPEKGFQFNILTVDKEYIARPDLISLDAYGTTLYADMLCKLNGISNPFELNEGMEIIIPTSSYISEFQVLPSNQELELSENDNKPVATHKTNKNRKANEAIINNTRFKIDSASGIIIY